MTALPKKPARLVEKNYGAEVVERDGETYVAIQAMTRLKDEYHCYNLADFLYAAGDYMKGKKNEEDQEAEEGEEA